MKTIWERLPRPFLVLAPLEDVSDTVFRRIVARCGRPDLFYTEFTNADGLSSSGFEQVSRRLLYTEEERPLIAQIWGSKPENYYKAAQYIKEQGFDGIDINMGCPVRAVISKGVCSALIKNHPLAKEIIHATKEGAGDLPVSVKTRIGFNVIQTEEWIPFLLKQDIAALTVHGRTVKELSKVSAHWDEIGKAVAIRDQMGITIPIIGNGDVMSRQEAFEKAEKYKLDGIMIGRGIFHDPWVFNKERNGDEIALTEKLDMLIQHIELFQKTWEGKKQFSVMKKFFKCYLHGFEGASDFRNELMQCNSTEEVVARVNWRKNA